MSSRSPHGHRPFTGVLWLGAQPGMGFIGESSVKGLVWS